MHLMLADVIKANDGNSHEVISIQTYTPTSITDVDIGYRTTHCYHTANSANSIMYTLNIFELLHATDCYMLEIVSSVLNTVITHQSTALISKDIIVR